MTVIDFRAEQTTTLVARAFGFNLDKSLNPDDGGETPATSTVDINGTTLTNSFKSVGGTNLKLTSTSIRSSQESDSIDRVYAPVVSEGTRFRKEATLRDIPNANLDIIFEITDGLFKTKSNSNALFPGSITISNEVTIEQDGQSDVVKTRTFKITGTLRKGQRYRFVQRVKNDNFALVDKIVVKPLLEKVNAKEGVVRFYAAGFNLNP